MSRRRVARLGESIAERFLIGRGAQLVGRNVRAGRGEIDLLMRMGRRLVAVEVKTRIGHDPRTAFDPAKAERTAAAARRLRRRPQRMDLVTVRLDRLGARVHWIPGVEG